MQDGVGDNYILKTDVPVIVFQYVYWSVFQKRTRFENVLEKRT